MDAKFSEFSYGFAATSELAADLRSRRKAPVFPSLLAEAKLGWDVKLQSHAGAIVFVQFKISEALTRSTASEWYLYGAQYFRIYIRRRRHSNQHNLLKALAAREPFVYYLAPRFYELAAFDRSYVRSEVLANSISFPVGALPRLKDDDQHYICFRTGADAYWCSEEKQEVKSFGAQHVADEIVRFIDTDATPLTSDRLASLRGSLLDVAGHEALTREMVARKPTYSNIIHDIEYLSRTFLSAEALFVTQGDQ